MVACSPAGAKLHAAAQQANLSERASLSAEHSAALRVAREANAALHAEHSVERAGFVEQCTAAYSAERAARAALDTARGYSDAVAVRLVAAEAARDAAEAAAAHTGAESASELTKTRERHDALSGREESLRVEHAAAIASGTRVQRELNMLHGEAVVSAEAAQGAMERAARNDVALRAELAMQRVAFDAQTTALRSAHAAAVQATRADATTSAQTSAAILMAANEGTLQAERQVKSLMLERSREAEFSASLATLNKEHAAAMARTRQHAAAAETESARSIATLAASLQGALLARLASSAASVTTLTREHAAATESARAGAAQHEAAVEELAVMHEAAVRDLSSTKQ